MESNEWDELGRQVKNMVEDAIDAKDFTRLSQNISDIANSAISKVQVEIKKQTYSSTYNGKRQYSSIVNKTEAFKKERKNEIVFTNNRYFKNMSLTHVFSVLKITLGYSFAFCFGLAFIGCLIGGLLDFPDSIGLFTTLDIIFGGLTVGCAYLGFDGCKKIGLAKRFKKYARVLNGKEYINHDVLADATNTSLKRVKADIKYLISKNWFVEGHLDKQASCLMVTDKMYQVYLENEKQSAALKLEEAVKPTPIIENEISEITKTKNKYLAKIRHCNDLIPGEEISAKISSIENIVGRIFERVEKHPENASDIKKMMNYYLPTTVKLLEAYVELDSQPNVGENIINSKKEIEDSLDTLNSAFEKLLNELFKDTAWDVSSDISVLNTILTQDGLKDAK